jgi:GAF domain-containing protein
MPERPGADVEPEDAARATARGQLSELGLDRGQVRSILAALRLVGSERSALARAQQCARLSVEISGAEHAVLVVYDGEDGDSTRLICSPEDAAGSPRLRAIVSQHEDDRFASERSGGRDHQRDVSPSPDVARIVFDSPPSPPGALYLLGGPAGVAEDRGLREFVRLAVQMVGDSIRYEESHQQLAWRPALADVTQLLLSSGGDDETEVWQRIVDHVLQLTDARTVTISTPDEDDPALFRVHVVAGAGHSTLSGFTYPRLGSLVDLAISTGSSQSGVSVDHLVVSHNRIDPQTALGPLLAIPLVGHGVPRGALVLSREADRQGYSSRDLTLVEEFAAQATLALELAETRAAQMRLQALTEHEQVASTFEDHVLQRLYALSLTLDLAAEGNSENWLEQARGDIAAAMAEARRQLDRHYGR